MILRVYWKLHGDLVRVKVFLAHGDNEGAFCGELTMHMREFVALTQGQYRTEIYEEETRQ